jgi:hypothetical protein
METGTKRKSALDKFLYLFSILMIAVYPVAGLILFFSPSFLPDKPPMVKQGIGTLLFLYGIYRLYRFVKLRKNNYGENNED